MYTIIANKTKQFGNCEVQKKRLEELVLSSKTQQVKSKAGHKRVCKQRFKLNYDRIANIKVNRNHSKQKLKS